MEDQTIGAPERKNSPFSGEVSAGQGEDGGLGGVRWDN
jgi:hypothetical protein